MFAFLQLSYIEMSDHDRNDLHVITTKLTID